MFGPSLLCEASGRRYSLAQLVSVSTMTAADFLAHRNQVYSRTSLGKVNILVSIAATSTILALSFFKLLDFGMMCYLIRPHSLSM